MHEFLRLAALPSTDVPASKPDQAVTKIRRTTRRFDFAMAVRIALLKRGESITDLAKAIGKSRVAVSRCIHHGIHRETRDLIASYLKIAA